MATYKAEFLAHYYAGRLRPRAMYALGCLPWAVRAVARVTWLPNRSSPRPAGHGAAPGRRAEHHARDRRPASPGATFRLRPVGRAAGRRWPRSWWSGRTPSPTPSGPERPTTWSAVLEATGRAGRRAVGVGAAAAGRSTTRGMLGRRAPTLAPAARRARAVGRARARPWSCPSRAAWPRSATSCRALLARRPAGARLAGLARSPAEHLLTLALPTGDHGYGGSGSRCTRTVTRARPGPRGRRRGPPAAGLPGRDRGRRVLRAGRFVRRTAPSTSRCPAGSAPRTGCRGWPRRRVVPTTWWWTASAAGSTWSTCPGRRRPRWWTWRRGRWPGERAGRRDRVGGRGRTGIRQEQRLGGPAAPAAPGPGPAGQGHPVRRPGRGGAPGARPGARGARGPLVRRAHQGP